MKRLFLLRHAQAVPGSGSDKDRPLTPRGKQDAQALGAAMAKEGYRPDYVLCSAAKRTQETWESLSVTLKATVEPHITDALYNAPSDKIAEEIAAIPNSIHAALIIAHNPGLHQLSASLAGTAPESLRARINGQFIPASFVALECMTDNWSDLKPSTMKIINFMDPLDYNAPATPSRWT